jgi:UDP-N-acetylmuramate--alanine ligase
MEDFARAFHQADTVHVTDIYAASEHPIEGVTSEALVEKLIAFGHRGAHYAGSLEGGVASVIAAASSGDVIVTLGAGSVSQAADQVLTRLKGDR